MQDMVRGQFSLPWEADVVHTDGKSCGFEPPESALMGNEKNMLEEAEKHYLFVTHAIKEAA